MDPSQPVPWKPETVFVRNGAYISTLRIGDGRNPLVLVHGITAHAKSFNGLARHLQWPDGVLAVNLRGRSDSYKPTTAEESGMAHHIEDLKEVLAHFNIEKTVIVGHSYGGFVGIAAARDPELRARVAGIVLLDSGFPRPEGGRAFRELTQKGIERAFSRLAMSFEDVNAYLRFWFPDGSVTRETGAVDVIDYFASELEPSSDGNGLRFKTQALPCAADGKELAERGATAAEMKEVTVPVFLVRVGIGLLPQSPPMITDEDVEAMRACLRIEKYLYLEELNHYNIMTLQQDKIAAAIDEFASSAMHA